MYISDENDVDIDGMIETHIDRTGHRADSFRFIKSELEKKNQAIFILETGCVRDLKNYMGDGCSTLLWDLLCENYGGKFISIDFDGETVAQAQQAVHNGSIWKSDSLNALVNPQIRKFAKNIDLLYLDSFDWSPGNGSDLHHLNEIQLIWHSLPEGCLIAVDDCHSETEGKHVQVAEFMKNNKVDVVKSGYVTVWRK